MTYMIEEVFLDANYWKEFTEDECNSLQIPCTIQVAEPFGKNFAERSVMLRIEYAGNAKNFVPSLWSSLVESIEHEFSETDYEIDLAYLKKSSPGEDTWQQWVIFPMDFRPRHK